MTNTDWKNSKLHSIHYTARSPWRWVVKKAIEKFKSNKASTNTYVEEVIGPKKLPSNERFSSVSSANPRQPCTLRMEFISSSNDSSVKIRGAHGISNTLQNLEDKDEFARVLSRWTCENICPLTLLLPWDAADGGLHQAESQQKWNLFCLQIRAKFPQISDNLSLQKNSGCLVLKAALGSQGDGIYFLDSLNEICNILKQHKKRALEEKGFLESLYNYKGRIPCWVLQAEIYPPLLLQEGKKFHLRSYILIIESPTNSNEDHASDKSFSMCKSYVYHHHEVRIASEPVQKETKPADCQNESKPLPSLRNRKAYITNGAGSDSTQRCLLHQTPELKSLNLGSKLEKFLAKLFSIDLLPEINLQLKKSKSTYLPITKFAIAGVDVMMDANGQLFVLEVNVNPAAPPENVLDKSFHDHLIEFMHSLIQALAFETNNDKDTNSELCFPSAFIPLSNILSDASN